VVEFPAMFDYQSVIILIADYPFFGGFVTSCGWQCAGMCFD
jgi:hypothetical protein